EIGWKLRCRVFYRMVFTISGDLYFLNMRRKYHRHHCPHRRCMPLHSRVPFP
uniref:Uncharacterized protein n=1 Tax=Esox lucius TaxID=8010 RepID=A0A3P8ZIY2_ESOLU